MGRAALVRVLQAGELCQLDVLVLLRSSLLCLETDKSIQELERPHDTAGRKSHAPAN